MENATELAKNTALVVAGLLAVFIGLGLISVIFGALTWEILGDWTLKLALAAIVIVVLGAVIGAIGRTSLKK